MPNSVTSGILRHLWGQALTGVLTGVLAISPSCAMAKTANGFVTRIVSPSDFYLDALHISLDTNARCISENLESDIDIQSNWLVLAHRTFALRDRMNPDSRIPLTCAAIHLGVGTHVEVIGNEEDPARLLHAARLTVYHVTVQQHFANLPGSEEWDGGTLIEEQPTVRHTGKDWAGTVWLDGYPMTVTPNTVLLVAPSGSELSFRGFGSLFWPRWGAVMPHTAAPPFAGNLFNQDTWAAYRGRSPYDDRWVGEGAPASKNVKLMRLRLWPNEVSNKERKFRSSLAPLVHPPDYGSRVSGTVVLAGRSASGNLEILADRYIHQFVSEIGESVIPNYQVKLSDKDDTKIHFQFYVIHGGSRIEDEMSGISGLYGLAAKPLRGGLVAFPNGTVLIPGYILAKMKNEAQLSSLLSCAVTTVLQKQMYISRHSHPAAWQPEYGSNPTQLLLPLFGDEQALRIGIRQMYLAGYDIREAPFAWAIAAGKPAVNPLIDAKDPDRQIPWYAAYAYNYISEYYKDVDFSKLKRGDAEYQQFLEELRKADPAAFEQKQ